jgi:DNA-binding HxlR family transcriptional regulator
VRPRPTMGQDGPVTSGLDEAMARVGDRWTLLVVDALLAGPRRFSELQADIPRLAPNVLTARLRRLERQGLVLAVPYSDRPPRLEYRITEAGRELAGALRLLARWGSRESGGDGSGGDGTDTDGIGPHHRSCGTALETRWYCPTCARVTDTADDDLRWV